MDEVASLKTNEGQLIDPENPDTMKIAWRYQNQSRVQVKHLLESAFIQ